MIKSLAFKWQTIWAYEYLLYMLRVLVCRLLLLCLYAIGDGGLFLLLYANPMCKHASTLHSHRIYRTNIYKTQRVDGTKNMRSTLKPKHSLWLPLSNGKASQSQNHSIPFFCTMLRTNGTHQIYARQISPFHRTNKFIAGKIENFIFVRVVCYISRWLPACMHANSRRIDDFNGADGKRREDAHFASKRVRGRGRYSAVYRPEL